ncbi:DUF2391 family protein [Halovivax gelatinilyticus]|uniref:DUF2391 family protein n=1 Tax=Halovivax gelatinilyticus TaxID=2961597 RepID=UPI0020CA8CB4|nr:DUF2391 family protein [Halovivax gelatinilyticus]
MSSRNESADRPAADRVRDDRYDVADVLDQLDELEATVSSDAARRDVQRTRRMVERVPGSRRIGKLTVRDLAEATVGAIVFALPLLVEDGVFEIAEWFTATTVGSIPLFLVANVLLVVGLTAGVLYATDFRDVVKRPVFGLVPRRLVVVLAVSFAVAASTMYLWGRLHEEDPTALEAFGRITAIWAAAALGASIADMLPGESSGTDIGDRLSELSDRGEGPTTDDSR